MSSSGYRGSSHRSSATQDTYTGRRSRKVVNLGVVKGEVIIDLAEGDVFLCVLGADASIRFTNYPAKDWCSDVELRLLQDATGARKVQWPEQGAWPGGRAHQVGMAPNTLDLVGVTVMHDGSWIGFPVEGVA